MNIAKKLDPMIDEFDAQSKDADYDAWFRAKVEKSLNDPRPGLGHQEAMALIDKELKRRKAARAGH